MCMLLYSYSKLYCIILCIVYCIVLYMIVHITLDVINQTPPRFRQLSSGKDPRSRTKEFLQAPARELSLSLSLSLALSLSLSLSLAPSLSLPLWLEHR